MKRLVILIAALLSLSLILPAVAADTKPEKAMNAIQAAQKKTEGAAAAAKQEIIDVNTATEAQLKAISGIGDVYSKKIIAGRPYAKKDQLVSKKILPKVVYDKIKDRIVAKQVKK